MSGLADLVAALAGRYAIERELGRGGMATVYLAHDVKHDRAVALKVLKPELAAALGPERFLREIVIAARLNHPHILPLYDSGEAAAFLYYVMPFVEGESLRDRLAREKQLPVDDALQIAREVADALSYAHSRDVVHRDIKPENILLESGHAVVADFGIARAISAAGGERLTETGLALGTPTYMSPEQAAGSGNLDGRSDLYSLGCVLYEMLAGEPPFTGPTAESVLRQHLTTEAPSVIALRAAVPPGVTQAIQRALAKTPADRYATGGQFGEALKAPPAAPASRRRASRSQRFAAATGVGVLAIGVLAALLLTGNRSRVAPAASVIAVLPMAPTIADTSLMRLGRDLVVTLSANLDGVGDIRTVDPLTILAQVKESAITLEDGARLARRLGATSVVHGTVVWIGDRVRLDVGIVTSDSLTPLGRSTVSAAPADLNALTDSITWALLRQVWRTSAPPTPSLGAVRTRSVPALRAFLEGERAVVEGRWGDAATAFSRAIEADSGFWLAYSRHAYARNWEFQAPDSGVTEAYRAHRTALPARERLLVEAELAESLSVRLTLLRGTTERFPDYWPAWLEYADWLVHFGPLLGFTERDARAALERVVALNPALNAGWTHLGWVATLERDTAASGRVVAALTRLGAADPILWENLQLFRVLDRLLRTGRAGASLDTIVGMMAAPPDLFSASLDHEFLWFGFPATQIDASRRVLERVRTGEIPTFHRRWIAMSWAARGAWDSALSAMAGYVGVPADERRALEAYGLAVAGAWLGALDPAATAAARATAARAVGEGTPEGRGELAWLDGLLAVARREPGGVATTRSALRQTGDVHGEALVASLDAFAAELRGERSRAAAALAAAEWDRAEHTLAYVDPDGFADAHPYVRPVHRLAASRWLLAEGDFTQAARLASWYSEVRPTLEVQVNGMLAGFAHLERARIEDAQGAPEAARSHYERFLARYDMPVPAHRHLVEEARAALARREGRRRE